MHQVAGMSLARQLATAAALATTVLLGFVALPIAMHTALRRYHRRRVSVGGLRASRGASVRAIAGGCCCRLRGPKGTLLPFVTAAWLIVCAFLTLDPRTSNSATSTVIQAGALLSIHALWLAVLVMDRHKGLNRNNAYLVFVAALASSFPFMFSGTLFAVLQWARTRTANMVWGVHNTAASSDHALSFF